MLKSKNRKIGAHCILACMYFLLLPATIAIDSAGNSILKLATVPIGLFFAFSILFTSKVLQFNVIHLLLGIFTCTTAITLFVDSGEASISDVIGYFLNAVLYICLSVVAYNDCEQKLLEDIQVVLLMILVGITLFSTDILSTILSGKKGTTNNHSKNRKLQPENKTTNLFLISGG